MMMEELLRKEKLNPTMRSVNSRLVPAQDPKASLCILVPQIRMSQATSGTGR